MFRWLQEVEGASTFTVKFTHRAKRKGLKGWKTLIFTKL